MCALVTGVQTCALPLVSGCFWVNRWNICTGRHKGKFSRTFPGFSGLHRAICSEQIVIECADKRSEEPCDLGSGVDFCWKALGRLELDRKSTRLNYSPSCASRIQSSA